jgi:hypothetical protein
MRFMMMVKSNAQAEAGVPDPAAMAEMGKYNAALAEAGVMLSGEGLHASSKGCRVHFDSGTGKLRVVDGPFAEAKELVAGYWLVHTPTLAEAVAWAKRVPFESGEVELRKLWEAEDFPAEPGIEPDAIAQEDQRMRDAAAANATAPAQPGNTRRYMLLVKGSTMTESALPPDPATMAKMGTLMEGLVASGAMLGGEGLRPSKEGARVRYAGRERSVIDGPFSETKELIAGFITIRGTKAEAIELAKRWAEIHAGAAGHKEPEAVIEVRLVAELEDFPVDASETPDGWRAQEQRMRERQQGGAR